MTYQIINAGNPNKYIHVKRRQSMINKGGKMNDDEPDVVSDRRIQNNLTI